MIETDARTIRELPASYVAEHVEHAYCLTGHGMQGGTVEHATVVAASATSPRAGRTPRSRARADTTRLHIDAARVSAAALEREEHAPTAARRRPQRGEVLARVAARMVVRDDEDLAVAQLPTRPAPGRPDDPAVHEAPRLASAALPEAGAERAAPAAAPATRVRLDALRHELEQLTAQRDSLPLRELRRLDAISAERAQLQAQREFAAESPGGDRAAPTADAGPQSGSARCRARTSDGRDHRRRPAADGARHASRAPAARPRSCR